MSDPSCKACSGGWPGSDHFIADLGLSMAYLHEDQFFPGWAVVVFKRHATELFHLAPTERIQLMEEVSRFAQVLTETFQAKKMNYGLLGNQMPHIHWHLIPRLHNDPAPLEPVWRVPHGRVLLSADRLQTTIARITKRLSRMV
ncbi:MAG TPA: HIT family protein [Nitrospira sp.]|jgi:diadenosine tetraphosphate (Ap4A) HIT family hydrolase|nr:HIT family protein [Nitrospira sp.]